MFNLGLQRLGTKRNTLVIFFLAFLGIHTVLDYLNVPYIEMAAMHGILIVITNITLNIIMSALVSLMLTLSIISFEIKGSETKSQNLGFISVLFGVLTYGCTSCVIGFFAAVGISYSVIALPFSGLPYKFISLILIMLGLLFTRYEMNKPCPIKVK